VSKAYKQLVPLAASVAMLGGLAIWALSDGVPGSPSVAAEPASVRMPAQPAFEDADELEDPSAALGTASEARSVNPGSDARTAAVEVRSGLLEALFLLQSVCPDRFGHMTAADAEALKSVDLRDSAVRDEDLERLAALPSLTSVCLRMTSVSDAGLKHLAKLPKLTTLDLSRTNVTRAGMFALPAERLEVLHLTDTAVKGEDLRWLPSMPKLSVLKLNGLDVGDDALAGLARFPSLEHLELSRTPVTDAGLRDILMQNRGLRRVDVWRSKVTADAITSLTKLHPDVKLNRG
jgi:hypothetical protein